MPKPYSKLARWYDELYSDAFYRNYATFIKHLARQFRITKPRILDVACGTGRLLFELLPDVSFAAGLDNSTEMLSQAKKLLPKVKFYHQDIQSIKVDEKYDLITCTFDSINYVLNIRSVTEIFRRISPYLDDRGIFIFDFNTVNKRANGLTKKKGVIYQDHIDGLFWIIDIKTPDGKERHRERLYTLGEVKLALEKSGMSVVKMYSDFNTETTTGNNLQRLIVVAQKDNS